MELGMRNEGLGIRSLEFGAFYLTVNVAFRWE